MTITTNLQLPDQPGAGEVTVVPLGGNGFLSPQFLQAFTVTVASDASGGAHNLRIRFDPLYCSVLACVSIRINAATADSAVKAEIMGSQHPVTNVATEVARMVNTLPIITVAGAAQTSILWVPPPIIMVGRQGLPSIAPKLDIIVANIDTESLNCTGIVYCFDKLAKENVPIEKILGSLPISGALVSSLT